MSQTGESAAVRPGLLQGWSGPSLCVLDRAGGISPEEFTGLYHHGIRFLSKLQLRFRDESPYVCSAACSESNNIEFSLIYPEVAGGGTGGSGSGMINRRDGLYERGLSAVLTYTVRPVGLDIDLRILNAWNTSAKFTTTWLLGADFESLQTVDDGRRDGGKKIRIERETEDLVFRYDRGNLYTHIAARGTRTKATSDRLVTRWEIPRGETVSQHLIIRAFDPADPMTESEQRKRELCREQNRKRLAFFESGSGERFARIFNGALDLVGASSGLHGTPDEWLTPVAGYPLYPFLFGRDSLTTSWMVALFDNARMLEHSLTKLGRLQGSCIDPVRDEEPGRIVQQARVGSQDRLAPTPFSRYYGDFASPLMYVISVAYLYACTGDLSLIRKHWGACRKVLEWAERFGDRDGDGYLEYKTESKYGPRNQGWKDSENAVVYEDGSLVPTPIATCELQGYYYAALQSASFFSFLLKEVNNGWAYLKKARRLKVQFNRDFWIEGEGYVGFGLDAKKRLIHVRSSNVGHCLAAGIIEKEKIPRVAEMLFSDDMYSGWGIRTLSSTHPAYNPLSYHLGSVWPVENATIAFGLRRYGFAERALQLVRDNVEMSELWAHSWVPECIGGFDRDTHRHPGSYPRANAPQVWNAAAYGLFGQVLLGMQPVAPLKTLLVDPILPEWLPDLTVRNLTIGGATLDIAFHRSHGGGTKFEVLRKTGRIHVLRQPAVNSLTDSPVSRLMSLLNGIVWG